MVPLPPFSVKLDIADVAYVTYMVPEERLRPAVPEKIPLAMTYEGKAFLSLVMFHNRNVRASFFPFIRFNYDQLNVRTYISDPVTGETAVLFLHSGITSGIMSSATKLLGIPWPVMSLTIRAAHENDRMTGYGAVGEWGGEVDIQLRETPEPDYTPFRDMKEAVEFLVTPTVGFYAAPGGVVRFEVQHTFLEPSAGSTASVKFPMLEEFGYLTNEELQHPHNVLVTPHGVFRVLLPPRLIRL
jgi:hypothetical protein